MLTKSQFLRKIPANPVLFYYLEGNDTLPLVQVMKLLHDEKNPGFLGVNLNYTARHETDILASFYRSLLLEYGYGDLKEMPTYDKEIEKHTHGCIRRYNYCSIGRFIYRGCEQRHQRKV